MKLIILLFAFIAEIIKQQKKMSFLKTLVNVGMNISNDYEVPVFKTLEKNKVLLAQIFLLFHLKFQLYTFFDHDPCHNI
jgi:hypothetical protein